jgi:hypothetical protein
MVKTDALLKKVVSPKKAKELVEVIEEPMDNHTINKYLPNCAVIRYNELNKAKIAVIM